MNLRRPISLFVLLAFIPLSVGCSTSRTLLVQADPADSQAHTRFRAGEPVEISGYTRPDDGFRDWRGYVQSVPPDSLQFFQESRSRNLAPPFRLAVSDVISIDACEFSPGKTAGFVVGLLAVGGIIAIAIIGHQISQMDLSVQI